MKILINTEPREMQILHAQNSLDDLDLISLLVKFREKTVAELNEDNEDGYIPMSAIDVNSAMFLQDICRALGLSEPEVKLVMDREYVETECFL